MIRIGIIGSGFGQYGLLPAFNSIKQCNVVALAGKKRPQLVAYCKQIGFTNIYADWKKMLTDEDLDAVAIAVTPSVQYEIAKFAILKGLHVFAEKPLTATLVQARKLLQLAQKKKIIHGVDFIFPEIAEWQKVKQLLDTQKYGKLKHVSTSWDFLSYDIGHGYSTWKTSVPSGGGALSFFFSHGLYYLEHFAGHIKQIQSVLIQSKESLGGGEVGAELLLTFKSGSTGYAHILANSRGLTRHELIFYCEHGVIVLKNTTGVVDNFSISVYTVKGERKINIKKDKGFNGEDERVKIVRKLAKRFIAACISRTPMVPSFKEGLRVQELIETARKKTI